LGEILEGDAEAGGEGLGDVGFEARAGSGADGHADEEGEERFAFESWSAMLGEAIHQGVDGGLMSPYEGAVV
jgi:hypothetical protein